MSDAGAETELRTVRALRWFARGRCLVEDEADGDTFLVDGAAPGERLRVQLATDAHGRRRGFVREVLEPADTRIPPMCGHALACPGCALLHVSPAAETAYLALTVHEVLARYAGAEIAPAAIEAVGSTERGDHRVRVHLHIEPDGQGGRRVGLRGFDGEIVHAPDCPAVTPEIRRLLGAVAAGETPDGARLGDGRVAIGGGDAWTQPSPARAATLYDWLVGLGVHDGARVLDATCGTGGMSLRLAARADSVLGVDANYEAVQAATAAAAAAGVENASFRGGKIQTVAPRLERDGAAFELVLINPMRRSLGPDAMATLGRLAARHVVYLAPAPRAGAEDLRTLLDTGWRLERVAAICLHPGTGRAMLGAVLGAPTER